MVVEPASQSATAVTAPLPPVPELDPVFQSETAISDLAPGLGWAHTGYLTVWSNHRDPIAVLSAPRHRDAIADAVNRFAERIRDSAGDQGDPFGTIVDQSFYFTLVEPDGVGLVLRLTLSAFRSHGVCDAQRT